jgi:hypothetical protein
MTRKSNNGVKLNPGIPNYGKRRVVAKPKVRKVLSRRAAPYIPPRRMSTQPIVLAPARGSPSSRKKKFKARHPNWKPKAEKSTGKCKNMVRVNSHCRKLPGEKRG